MKTAKIVLRKVGNDLVLFHNRRSGKIRSGFNDSVSAFKIDNGDLIVISYNEPMGYAGAELFDSEMKRKKEVFFQDMEELKGVTPIRKAFFDYSDRGKALILNEYLDYMD